MPSLVRRIRDVAVAVVNSSCNNDGCGGVENVSHNRLARLEINDILRQGLASDDPHIYAPFPLVLVLFEFDGEFSGDSLLLPIGYKTVTPVHVVVVFLESELLPISFRVRFVAQLALSVREDSMLKKSKTYSERELRIILANMEGN